MAPLKVETPKFNGDPLLWKPFELGLVSQLKHRAEGYSREDKYQIIRQSIIPQNGKSFVDQLHATGSSTDELIAGLKEHYGRPQLIVPLLVEKVTNVPHIEDNAASIRKFVESVIMPYKNLESLLSDHMSQLFPHLYRPYLKGKLKEDWDKLLRENLKDPSMKDFIKFLNQRLLWSDNHTPPQAPTSSMTAPPTSTPSIPEFQGPPRPANGSSSPSSRRNHTPAKCPSCGEGHLLVRCTTFAALPVDERNKLVREKRLRLNCFGPSHAVRNCSSKYSCRHCHQRHHSLLHRDGRSAPSTAPPTTTPTSVAMVAPTPAPPPQEGRTNGNFICSVAALVKTGDKATKARVLLDHGSGASFMSIELADTLNLKRLPHDGTFTGADRGTIRTRHKVIASLKSTVSDYETPPIEFLLFPKKLSSTPPQDREGILHLASQNGLVLSDPSMGGVVDILLGEEHPWDLCGGVTAIERYRFISSKFGYGVVGPLASRPQVYTILPHDSDLHNDLSRLWDLDRVPEASPFTPDEQKTLKHYNTNVKVQDNRIQVKLPVKDNSPALGDTRRQALSRLYSNEKSLSAKDKLSIFNEALHDYLKLGHAHIIPKEELLPPHEIFYLPVHGVFKDSSSTTKVRPVFDASARSTTGTSLNDKLHVGPNLYPHLEDILIKFRTYAVGLTADIGKMFREILLHPEHHDLHRFLLRLPCGSIADCRMSRLTFGVASSPFLATQSLRHLAELFQDSHPQAAHAILHQFYVDDFVAGAKTTQEAIQLRNQLCDLLRHASMNLRKWRSNSINFIKDTPPELREEDINNRLHLSSSPKALGLHWDTTKDLLLISVPDVDDSAAVTKRTVASVSAGVYDLLGLFAPATIKAKLLLREAWRRRLPWDKPLPDDMKSTWSSWVEGLASIKQHLISRTYFKEPSVFVSLHGFSDASDVAYGAVVYLRAVQVDGSIHTALVTAKARVLPLKHITVPRAELLGALLLAKLLASTAKTLDIAPNMTFAWSDSSIVLSWLSKSPSQIKDKFVANRTQVIQDTLPSTTWRHVATDNNPADHASRGVEANSLIHDELWWQGPPWLSQPPSQWPTTQVSRPQEEVSVLTISPTPRDNAGQDTFLNDLWTKFSSVHKLTRVVAWIFRFFNNSKKASSKTQDSDLSSAEVHRSMQVLIALSQKQSFPEIHTSLNQGKLVNKSHHLANTNVSINNGLLICQSRVRNPDNLSQPKNLYPLDVNSKFTILLCSTLHVTHHHPGISALHASFSSTYLISGLRNLLKKLSRACALCQRAYAKPISHLMGMLPAARTTPTPAFYVTGVDFAGPLYIRQGHVRKPVPVKTYAALFICMVTKAVHIELCASLSSVDFRAALQRFIARRGSPGHIYCDNGSNFLGAREETRDLRENLESRETTIAFCQAHHIQWHHSPPRAPHFGGLWEAAIRQMKLILKKNASPHLLRYDELETVLTEAEAILNSRPLAPITQEDQHTGNVLTAGHFLIGRPLLATPALDTHPKFVPSLRRWKLVARIQEDIWKQWSNIYINTLHQRSKWKQKSTPLKVQQLVYIKDESLSHRQWPLGIIQEVFPGDDGQVRAARILRQGKSYVRAANLLIPCIPEDHPLTQDR